MRESGLSVRVVRRPHDVVGAVPVEQIHEDRIVDERGIYLPLDVFAGLERQFDIGDPAPRVFVDAIKKEWYPGDVIFGRHDLEAWESLENAADDQRRQRAFDRMDHGDDAGHKLDALHIWIKHLA